jgi:hypothetical protein
MNQVEPQGTDHLPEKYFIIYFPHCTEFSFTWPHARFFLRAGGCPFVLQLS